MMHFIKSHKILFTVGFFAFLPLLTSNPETVLPVSAKTEENPSQTAKHEENHEIVIFGFDIDRVRVHFDITLLILVASIAKILFHIKKSLPHYIPESCLLIALGAILTIIMQKANIHISFTFTADLFFLILLPWIIYEAGYFVDTSLFFDNIGTILSFAVMGTIFNIFSVGLFLWGLKGIFNFTLTLPLALLFSSLLAAVDPVAVLAVFEEMKVKETLYILVFGESILNDAVTVAMYHLFQALVNYKVIGAKESFQGIASFIVTSLGGTIVGILFGLLCGFITRFTGHVSVIEPMLVILVPYLGYLFAEMFHFSGIIAIMFCGIIMKPYVELNVSDKSRITIKYFVKTLSSTSDTLIFLFLGASVFLIKWKFDFPFIFLTIFAVIVFRGIGIMLFSSISNRLGRLSKITWKEQVILVYGGLRGAVSFSLASVLNLSGDEQSILISTTTIVVFFTIMIQGATFRLVLKYLKIKTGEEYDQAIFKDLNIRIFTLTQYAIEEIMGVFRPGRIREFFMYLDDKFIRPTVLRKKIRSRANYLVNKNLRLISKGAGTLAMTNPELVVSTEMMSKAQEMGLTPNLEKSGSVFSFQQTGNSSPQPNIPSYNSNSLINMNSNAFNKPAIHQNRVGIHDMTSLDIPVQIDFSSQEIQQIYRSNVPTTRRYKKPPPTFSNKYSMLGIGEQDESISGSFNFIGPTHHKFASGSNHFRGSRTDAIRFNKALSRRHLHSQRFTDTQHVQPSTHHDPEVIVNPPKEKTDITSAISIHGKSSSNSSPSSLLNSLTFGDVIPDTNKDGNTNIKAEQDSSISMIVHQTEDGSDIPPPIKDPRFNS